MHAAAYEGSVEKIHLALEAGEDVDDRDNRGATPLMNACGAGHVDAARALLEAGALVNYRENNGWAALMYAAMHGHVDAMGVLIEAGALVDSIDKDGWAALLHASANGHAGAVRVLIEAGAAVDWQGPHGATALMCASAKGHEGPMRVLLECGAVVDTRNIDGMTGLIYASMKGHEVSMRQLLAAGAAVDFNDNATEVSPLISASMNGHEGAIKVLLEAGATIDLIDKESRTALVHASSGGHLNAVRVLLEAGAAVGNAANATALVSAIGRGHLEVARVLLTAGADPSKLPPRVPGQQYHMPDAEVMQRLLALHREERRAKVANQAIRRQAGTEAAEAAAEAAADALLAEEEAEKSSAESRQAKAKRKKQRQKTKRAEAVPEAGDCGPGSSGADPPSQCSHGQAAGATGEGGEGGERAAAEEQGTALAAPLDSPPVVVTVSAEEVLRALEAAGSDGEVGEGGFGKVFAAELPSLFARWGRVAVKCASGLHAADILLEVATLRLCNHRNVLPLLGYCDDARAPCMITPLMHGGSLDDRLLLSDSAFERLRRLGFKGDACLNWQQRLSALCDAARGLAHLHGERILHRDVKSANILLEGALSPLPLAHGPPLLVHRAVLSDVGLAKVREPTLGGTTTHATTRNLAFSMGFGDPDLLNSNQHSEKTDAFGIGICVLMSLVSVPAAGLLKDHAEDVCDAFEDGTGPLSATAHAAAGWPADTARALAAVVHGLSIARNKRRQPLAEALAQMEALLGAVGVAAGGKGAARAVVGAASAVSRPPVPSSRGASMPPAREAKRPVPGARAVPMAPAQPEPWSGGELTRMVRKLEVGDADAPLARKRERVTKAYDSMMVRLERVYADQGHAPLPAHEEELRKIDLLAPRQLGRLNGLAHTLRKWWNAAKHQRDQWTHPPSDKEVQRLVREVIKELDELGW